MRVPLEATVALPGTPSSHFVPATLDAPIAHVHARFMDGATLTELDGTPIVQRPRRPLGRGRTAAVALCAVAIAAVSVVVVAVLTALTLLPVLFYWIGPAINWPKFISQFISRSKNGRNWHRLALNVMKRPMFFFFGTMILLLIL